MITNKQSNTLKERAQLLIRDIINQLNLDLHGLNILTEMGSGHFIYTPFIAALAGAQKVVSVVKDSPYGKRADIVERGKALARNWGIWERIYYLETVSPEVIALADLVTNLGFVRPINSAFITYMKQGAVIPYMREAWEYRPEDVDLAACAAKHIPVMGTYENYGNLGIFDQCGPLAAKMVFEAGLELKQNLLLVVSEDQFGPVLVDYLRLSGADARLEGKNVQQSLAFEKRIDGLIVADFSTDELILGKGGWINPAFLAESHPETTVIQLAGNVDPLALSTYNITFYPEKMLGPHRMTRTLADLGPKPVIDLHAAGLKVGELMWRERQAGVDIISLFQKLGGPGSLCQPLKPFPLAD